jgi:hypothetical protein
MDEKLIEQLKYGVAVVSLAYSSVLSKLAVLLLFLLGEFVSMDS